MENKEKIAELETRVKAFNEELIALLGKHNLGLGAIPYIDNTGRIVAKPHLFDDTPKPEEEKKELTKSE